MAYEGRNVPAEDVPMVKEIKALAKACEKDNSILQAILVVGLHGPSILTTENHMEALARNPFVARAIAESLRDFADRCEQKAIEGEIMQEGKCQTNKLQ